jgi:hypothetical protein
MMADLEPLLSRATVPVQTGYGHYALTYASKECGIGNLDARKKSCQMGGARGQVGQW